MTIIDPIQLFFAGDNKETIAVVVKSTNTTHTVNAVLDGKAVPMQKLGPQSSGLSFDLDMSKNDPSHLGLFFHFFSTGGGGLYKVVIRGSNGPTSFGMLVPQPLAGADSKIYTFDVI